MMEFQYFILFYSHSLGSNAQLTYTITSDTNFFDIEPRTGVVSVKNEVLDVPNKFVSIDVQVKDGGIPGYVAYTNIPGMYLFFAGNENCRPVDFVGHSKFIECDSGYESRDPLTN